MVQPDKKKPSQATEEDIDAPRLTPQGRENPEASGEDFDEPDGRGCEERAERQG